MKELKLDPELTKLSIEFIKDIEKIRTCPGCGKYLGFMFFCVNPECDYEEKEKE